MNTNRDLIAREAGHIIYNSFSENGSTRSTNSFSEHPSGHFTKSTQRMSPIRRTFCLFVVFDVVFSFILWVIYKQITDVQGIADFTAKDLCFRTSLFDIVLVAAGRFIVLILSYALFKSTKPWPVAATTLGTCCYLVAKAVMYRDWSSSVPTPSAPSSTENVIIDATMFVVSFILSWVETWLLDFKVLPWEEKMQKRAVPLLNGVMASERQPLLQDSNQTGYHTAGGGDSYYSPIESRASPPESRDERFVSAAPTRPESRAYSFVSISSRDETLPDYVKLGEEALETAWRLISMPESGDQSWHPECTSSSGSSRVFSRRVPKHGKIFKMTSTIDSDARGVYTVIVDKCEDMPEWNKTLTEVRVLHRADDSTLVAYNVAAAAAGGVVASRDFVYVMRNVQRDGWLVSSYVSTTFPAMPPQSKHVRAEQRPGLVRVRDTAPGVCLIESLLDTDLKGWLPQYLIDQAMSSVMLTYMEHLKIRCARHTASLAHA